MVKTACISCGKKDSLHRFPSNYKRCSKWLEQCNRLDLLEKGVKVLHQNYRLCKRHFKPWCFTSDITNCLIRCAHPEIFGEEEDPSVPAILPAVDEQMLTLSGQVKVLNELIQADAAQNQFDMVANPVVPTWADLQPYTISGVEPPPDAEVLRLFLCLKEQRTSQHLQAHDTHEIDTLLALAADWPNLNRTPKKALYNRACHLLAMASVGWSSGAVCQAPRVPEELLQLPPGS